MENSEQNKNSFFTREYAPQGTYPYLPLNEERNPVMAVSQSHTTVVSIQPNNVPVRDHLVWSIFNTAYLNTCCLGLLALVFSVKSRDRKLIGDVSGSISYASTARSLNISATVLSILSIILFFVLIVTGVIHF
ncbi:dispanin subfamily A member 2b-like [Pelobates fuscus]|uniref:dispanin subfamily A member 2b-like n=1 Tax=Pelobates fuscus TaxID=191477 RepID=UPI002FE49967